MFGSPTNPKNFAIYFLDIIWVNAACLSKSLRNLQNLRCRPLRSAKVGMALQMMNTAFRSEVWNEQCMTQEGARLDDCLSF